MKKAFIIILCLSQMFNAGCASIVKGTRQTVAVETNPPGATISIGQTHETSVSPAQLTLKRKNEYELKIEKPGYRTEYVQVDRNLSGWFWANFVSWGLIGIIVDLTNGAGYKLEPKEVNVELKKE